MISIKRLYKSYQGKTVLTDVNLVFDTGKTYGIVGANGAGKTTLFNCITGLIPCEGEIVSTVQPLKDNIGYLTAEPFFFPYITGEEYIRLLCNARSLPLDLVQEINIFDLPLGQYADTYSTGMKKKLALTAVLAQRNTYLILDEPFNGVDVQSNILIQDLLLNLKALKKTILISSHIFSTLRDICDEIVLIQDGVCIKKVDRSGFEELEQLMKQITIGDRVEKMIKHL